MWNLTDRWNKRLICQCLAIVLLFLGTTARGVERIYYHVNHPSGSPAMIVEPDGAVVARYAYAPFGAQVAASPTSSRQRLGFVGGIQETPGLHYLKHRYYNPQLGRFYQPDPVGFVGGGVRQINRYGYGANDPYHLKDPDGRQVYALFNTRNEELSILDMDHYDPNRSFVFVSNPDDYDFSGDTKNQVLVIPDVFSGENRYTFKNDSRNVAIEHGRYEILDNHLGGDSVHRSWFRLDKIDSFPRDDWSDSGRGNFRLHPGQNSWGCVTIDKSNPDNMQAWAVLSRIMRETSKEIVNGSTVQKGRLGSTTTINDSLVKYGEIRVK